MTKKSTLSYRRLAQHAITNNRQTYLPYMLAATFTVMVFYILLSLSSDPAVAQMHGGSIAAEFMKMGSVIVGLFAIIFLFYTNSFLMKRRKKELGLYNILGMEKKHIARILFWETIYASAVSIVSGVVLGICCNKLAYLLIVKLLRDTISMGFYLSAQVITTTVLLFAVIFLLTFLNAMRQIHLTNPIELLRSTQSGEREPQAKKLIAVLGVLCLGAGYAIALTIEQPILQLLSFVGAIILVIIGTYCLFIAGSITLLKLLKKKKSYYYTPNHFISISGLLYRMKQNAAGLANICVLSTMVLVLLTSTLSLMLGVEEGIDVRNPYDFTVYALDTDAQQNEQWIATTNQLVQSQQEITTQVSYSYMDCAVLVAGSQMHTLEHLNNDRISTLIRAEADAKTLLLIPYSSYLNSGAEPLPLADDQLLLYAVKNTYTADTLSLNDQTYQIQTLTKPFVHYGMLDFPADGGYYAVMTDAAFQQFQQTFHQPQNFFYALNLNGDATQHNALVQELQTTLETQGFHGRVESKDGMATELLSMYGGLLFLGCFLGAIFLVATVLIIYYKQITEGYEDKKRYEIMQKVGMSQQEVKTSINAQIRTVFFLPLLMAALHLLFCLPALYKMLAMLGLMHWQLLIVSTVSCFTAFAVFYVTVFVITSRTYYQIVKR